jgi:hypothetical protein
MTEKSLGSEKIVAKLQQVEVLQSHGESITAVCEETGRMEDQKMVQWTVFPTTGYIYSINAHLREKLLNGQFFYALAEARVIVKSWRRCYSTL